MTDLTKADVEALLDGTTPGPWMVGGVRCKIDRHDSHSILRYDAEKKRDETISNVWYDPKTGLGRADARLIASAPDLARFALAQHARAEEAEARNEQLIVMAAERERDAESAQAAFAERAAKEADPWDGPVTKNKIVDAQAIAAQQIKARIRALPSDTGRQAIAELRAKLSGWISNAQVAREKWSEFETLHELVAAENARLRADLAAAQAGVERLVNLLKAGRLAEQQLIAHGFDGCGSGLTAALAALAADESGAG